MRVEGNRNPRSGNLSGSCAYAGEHTAEGIGIRFYGIPEGKEQSDDLRTVREPEIQVLRKGVLVPRILRRYSWEEQAKDCGIYPASAGRG